MGGGRGDDGRRDLSMSGAAKELARRVGRYLHVYARFTAGGVKSSSLLLYPVRRRIPPRRSQLDLGTGDSLVSPASEPLLTMFEESFVDRRYAPEEWRPTIGATIIDIGANVGVFTLWAVRHAGAGRVIALEPSRACARALLANVERNGLHEVTVLQLAVGGERHKANLYRRGPRTMNTLYDRDNYGSSFHADEQAEVVTLDDLFDLFNVDRCGLLKLDCEGAEYEILLNASPRTLSCIDAIAAEYHVGLNEHGPADLREVLERQGFVVTCFDLMDVESGHLHAVRPR